MTIPALVLLGFGHSLVAVVGAGLLFGVGYGMFDANNMPILCQIISAKYRATAYGVMNMVGVFVGAMVTQVMGICLCRLGRCCRLGVSPPIGMLETDNG